MAEKSIDIPRLCEAILSAELALQPFRQNRLEVVRQISGNRYARNGARKKTYVNLLAMYMQIIGRTQIANNPRVMYSTLDRAQQPTVSAMEQWVNDEIERSNTAVTLGKIVQDALISIGIAKVSLATPSDAAMVGWGIKAGTSRLSRVDLDDFIVGPMRSRDFEEISFIGHRFYVPLDTVRDDSRLYSSQRKDLVAATYENYNRAGDERVENIGSGHARQTEDEFEDMVCLCEIYVPRHRCVYTFSYDQIVGPTAKGGREPQALREQDWVGPDCGPYHILGYNWLPGNLMPYGPLLNLVDLDDAFNENYRKLIRQAARLKGNPTFMDEDEAQRFAALKDGQCHFSKNPQVLHEVVTGGPTQSLFVLLQELWSRFNAMAGNLETIGGLAPQAKTATQEQLLATQSNGQVAAMQGITTSFIAKVFDAWGWYWWHDPQSVQKSAFSQPGTPEIGTPSSCPASLPRSSPRAAVCPTPVSRPAACSRRRSTGL